jgi:hypothetical protein
MKKLFFALAALLLMSAVPASAFDHSTDNEVVVHHRGPRLHMYERSCVHCGRALYSGCGYYNCAPIYYKPCQGDLCHGRYDDDAWPLDNALIGTFFSFCNDCEAIRY